MNLWSTFGNCEFVLSLHCAILTLSLKFTYTENFQIHYIMSNSVESSIWPSWWKELVMFMNKCSYIICGEKKPQLSNSQYHSKKREMRESKRKEIKHLENMRPSHWMLCAAILNSFIWLMVLWLTMIILTFMNLFSWMCRDVDTCVCFCKT